MRKRKKANRKRGKTGWIYSIICMVVIVSAGIGWIFLSSRCKEIAQQKQKAEAEVAALEAEQKEMIQKKQKMEEENLQANASEEEPEDLIIEEVSEPLELVQLEELIQSRIADRTALGEKWSVYVRQLSDSSIAVVGSGKQKAASLIKLYIMGAVYEQYDLLAAQYEVEEVDRLLAAMITVSDNEAANELTRMLGKGEETAGKAQVNAYCQEKGYADSSMGRMLLEDSAIGENYTSVIDCGNFLFDVYLGRHPHADQMLNLLKQQQRIGKIPAGVPEGVETANKTGELADVENDVAMILAEGRPYILCVMADQLSDTQAAREKIVELSSEIYGQVK